MFCRWAAAGLLFAAGCSRTIPPKVTADDGKRLGAIAFAYQRAGEQLGRPPQSVADLQPHLKMAGDPAELLRSPRDGQPYVIVWGVDLEAPFERELPVIAYEQRGAGGERMVLNLMGIVPLTDAEFAALALPVPSAIASGKQ